MPETIDQVIHSKQHFWAVMHLLILDGSRKTELFYSLIKKAFFIYETKKKNLFCIHIQTMAGKPITQNTITLISISLGPIRMG